MKKNKMTNSSIQKLTNSINSLIITILVLVFLVFTYLYLKNLIPFRILILGNALVVAIALGYFLPSIFTMVFIFGYLVTYVPWLYLTDRVALMPVIWIVGVPLAMVFANQTYRSKKELEIQFNYYLDESGIDHSFIEPNSKLLNINVLKEKLNQEYDIKNKFPDYNFDLVMIKIEHLSSLKELVGSEKYEEFYFSILKNIRGNISFETQFFGIEEDTIVVLVPLSNHEKTDKIENFIIEYRENNYFETKKNKKVSVVLKMGLLSGFEITQNNLNMNQIIINLKRKVELDLVGEYLG